MTRSDLALAALATAAVPGMQPVSVVGVRPSHARARYRTAVVEDATGRRWLVRAPRDRASGAELERNDGLIRLLGRHLPFKVPAAAGYANSKHGRAAVYPFVEGRPLRLRSLPPGQGLAAAVGRAIAAVHNIPRELFEEAGAPVFDAAGYRNRLLAALDRAAETGHVPTGLLARWEEALEAAPLWQFATTPTHGSLDGSSFLVAFTGDDAASGRVVALTGWERAQVADPADDFAMLVHQASPPALDAVLDSYTLARSQRPDPHLVTRARLAAEMRLVHGLATAVWAEDRAEVEYRADQLRKLDRLTSVDDSLVPRTVHTVGALYDSAAEEPLGDDEALPDEPAGSPEAEAAEWGPEPQPPTEGITEQRPDQGITEQGPDQQHDPAQDGVEQDRSAQPAAPADSAAPPEALEPREAEASDEADITTEIPVLRPDGEAPAPEAEPEAGRDADAGEPSLEPDAAGSMPDETAWEVSPAEPQLEETAGDEGVPVTDLQDEALPQAEPPGQDEALPHEEPQLYDGQEHAELPAAGTEPSTAAESSRTHDQEEGLSDEAVTERLHTLYGMPVPEETDHAEPESSSDADEATGGSATAYEAEADAPEERPLGSEGDQDGTTPGRGGAAS